MRRIVITDREDNPIVGRWTGVEDSAMDYQFVWKPLATSLGTTVSSVAYTTDESGVAFSANSVTDSTASIRITPSQEGSKLIKMTATMADASVAVRYTLLSVSDPQLAYVGGNYPWR